MTSSTEIINLLNKNLATNFLIYHSETPHLEDGSLAFDLGNSSKTIPYNEVFLIKKIGSPMILIDLENQKEVFRVLQKDRELQTNLFILADAEQNLSSEHFCLVFEKYLAFVIVVMETCDFELINLKFDFKNELPEDILTAFEIQFQSFKTHFNELLARYNIKVIDTERNISKKTNYKTQIPQNLNCETSQPDIKPKTLAFYISHENNDEIEKIIFENFKDKKGKTYRCIIEYLHKYDLLTLEQGEKQKIYNAFENMFDHYIGSYQSMWGYKVNRGIDNTYKNIRKILVEKFKGIL
ncbi:hypothetical protein [Lutibacter sp.]|uniref:hypothetical protein n=1 Tax=Lutibacter sp. TaxID=1925666 RepID=UPI00356A208E